MIIEKLEGRDRNMFCKKCGNQLNDGAAFCPKCGCKVGAKAEQSDISSIKKTDAKSENYGTKTAHASNAGELDAVNAAPTKKRHSLAIILASVFGTIIVLSVLIIILMRKNPSSNTTVNAVPDAAPEIATAQNSMDESALSKQLTEVDTDVNTEDIEKLLAMMDETIRKYDELRETSGGKEIKDGLQNTEDFIAFLDEKQKQVQSMELLPSNVAQAGNDFYELYKDAMDVTYMDNTFMMQFDSMSAAINIKDPVQSYYDFKEQYDAINCPDNLKNRWGIMEDEIAYWAEYVNRMNDATNLNDPLRESAAQNYIDRFYAVYKNETKAYETWLSDELDFAWEQILTADSIYDELSGTFESEPDRISEHKFEYNTKNVIIMPEKAYECIDTIYPSLYNSYHNFLTVKIGCLQGEREIIVECEIPGLSQRVSQNYRIGSGLTVINIKPPASNERLNLNTAQDSQLEVKIVDKNDQSILIDQQSFPVHIASRNDFEWYSEEFGEITQDNILCFLAPDSEAVAKLKSTANDNLSSLTNGKMNGLVGYQGPYYLLDNDGDGKADNVVSAEFSTTFLQAASLMRAMSDMGVRYTNDTFSITNEGQHILFPDQVLERKTGLCIETSLVVASALQSMGMHTFLVLPPGHAQVAVETWEGSGEYFLIETTNIPNTNSDFVDDANFFLNNGSGECDYWPITYYNSNGWTSYLESYTPDDSSDDCYVIDCSDGAILGLTPFAY